MAVKELNSEGPIPIEYKRWRHKERGYLVSVLQVHNHKGHHGYHTTVVVERKGEARHISWPARRFLQDFEPKGRRVQRRSRWDFIGDDLT